MKKQVSLYLSKPELSKSYLKQYKLNKWALADAHIDQLKALGFDAVIFEKSVSTPHIRVEHCDYWPASTRWYDFQARRWGAGFIDLKTYIVSKYKKGN